MLLYVVREVLAMKECPQGGVLSPFQWSLEVDVLWATLNPRPNKEGGGGYDKSRNGTRGNLKAKPLKPWLSLSRKRKGNELWTRCHLQPGDLYGFTLYSKLTWNEHTWDKLCNERWPLMTNIHLLEVFWGLESFITYWLYVTAGPATPLICFTTLVAKRTANRSAKTHKSPKACVSMYYWGISVPWKQCWAWLLLNFTLTWRHD